MAQENNTLIIVVILIVALAFYINKGMVKYGTRNDDSNSKGESTSSGCSGCGGKFLLGILFAIVAFIGILIVGQMSNVLALCGPRQVKTKLFGENVSASAGWKPVFEIESS